MENNEPKTKEQEKEALTPDELRRKILKIAKELFLLPIEESVKPKEKSPSQKQIMAKLTQREIEFFKNNADIIFPKGLSERIFWDVYSKSNTEKRRDILLRMVAEDDCLRIEKRILKETGCLPKYKDIINELPEDERNILTKITTPISSTIQALDTLSSKDRAYFLMNGSLPVERSVDTELQELYIKYVEQQKDSFEVYINFINELLCELKKYRLVHDSTRMSARVKSSDSAVNNDSKKALDDVFGLEIDFSNESEKELIEQIVASTITITKEKHHDKKNGYKAYHCSGFPSDIDKKFEESKLYNKCQELFSGEIYFNNLMRNMKVISEKYKKSIIEELKKSSDRDTELSELLKLIAIVEFQFKTIHVALDAINGPASHWKYKNSDNEASNDDEKEKEIELKKFMKEIQEKYTLMIKMFGKIPLSQVATMWESTLDGKPPRQLSTMEVVKHIYPFFIDPKDLEEVTHEQNQSYTNGGETR